MDRVCAVSFPESGNIIRGKNRKDRSDAEDTDGGGSRAHADVFEAAEEKRRDTDANSEDSIDRGRQ